MENENRPPQGEAGPTRSFVLGPERTPLVKALRTDSTYARAIDRVLDTRGNSDEHEKAVAEANRIGQETMEIPLHYWESGREIEESMPQFVVREVQKAMLRVPDGTTKEQSGAQIAKAISGRANEAEWRAQEIRDQMVADGLLSDEQDRMMQDQARIELLRLAAHAQETGRPNGGRTEVLEALKPLSGQIDTNWDINSWVNRVSEAKKRVSTAEPGEGPSGRNQETGQGSAATPPSEEQKEELKDEKEKTSAWRFIGKAGILQAVLDEVGEVTRAVTRAARDRATARIDVDTAADREKAAERLARVEALRAGQISPPEAHTAARPVEAQHAQAAAS